MSSDARDSRTLAELAEIQESIAKELADPTLPEDTRRELEARRAAVIGQWSDAFRRECSSPSTRSFIEEFSNARSDKEMAAIALRHGVGPGNSPKEYEIWAIETPAVAPRSWWQKIKDKFLRRP
jgi:hypothetical protein